MNRALINFVTVFVLTSAAWAGDEADHRLAARLVEQGAILPLEQILRVAEPTTGGRLIDVELENEHGHWVYELEYLENGVVWEYTFDASSGALLERERD